MSRDLKANSETMFFIRSQIFSSNLSPKPFERSGLGTTKNSFAMKFPEWQNPHISIAIVFDTLVTTFFFYLGRLAGISRGTFILMVYQDDNQAR